MAKASQNPTKLWSFLGHGQRRSDSFTQRLITYVAHNEYITFIGSHLDGFVVSVNRGRCFGETMDRVVNLLVNDPALGVVYLEFQLHLHHRLHLGKHDEQGSLVR